MAHIKLQPKERKVETVSAMGKLVEGSSVALVGADGMLGNMVQALVPKNIDLISYTLPEFDITDPDTISTQLHHTRPDIIINCAAMTDVDGCESHREQAYSINGAGPGYLATTALEVGATLMHISTDFVFSGTSSVPTSEPVPYRETDRTEPLSVYGASKRQGEIGVESSGLHEYFIVRTSWLYGPWGKNFVETIIGLAHERKTLNIISDQTGTPTYSYDLAKAIWALLQTDQYGIYHYSNAGQCNWYQFACEIVRCMQETCDTLRVEQINPISTAEYPLPAQRPAYSVLEKNKIIAATGIKIPAWQESLKRYLRARAQG